MHNAQALRWLYTSMRRWMPVGKRSAQDYFFVHFVGSGAVFLLLMSPWLGYLGRNAASHSALLCALTLLAIGFFWLKGLSLKWASTAYQATLMLVIVYNVVLDGGVSSSMMAWLSIVPLLPLFTLTRVWTIVWLGAAFAMVVGLCVLQLHGWIPLQRNETPEQLITSASMYVVLCLTQLLLVINYDSVSVSAMRRVSRQNERLQMLSVQLRQANTHKDRFLATVTHELRTPLNAIMGYLGLIVGDKQAPAGILDHADHAFSASEHLVTVINDLLDYSQIQQGRLVLTPQVVDAHKTLKSAHQLLLPRAQSKGLNYTLSIGPSVPRYLSLDPHRLMQILLNLLGNAIKFTDHGEVALQVDYEADPHNPLAGQLRVLVKDTGHGMAEKDIPLIFEPFKQLVHPQSLSNTNALKGNGLGLAITRSLVQRWQGGVEVKSILGVGTQFTVTLPVVIATQEPDAVQHSELQMLTESLDLLLVDDHHINRMVARATILRTMPNARIDEAANGTQAFEKMSQKLYDLVLMDLVMPDLSGTEVVAKVRSELPAPFNGVNVVAFTANVSEDAVQACNAVGIKSTLPKPFNADALISTIRQYAA